MGKQPKNANCAVSERNLRGCGSANLGEKLKTYKIEISNCEYLSRKLRDEGAQHEEASYRLEEEAVNAERLARQAEEEIRRLEEELEKYPASTFRVQGSKQII